MGIFYPDNSKRKSRVDGLYDSTQMYLDNSRAHYVSFKADLETCNQLLKEMYGTLNIESPSVENISLYSNNGVKTGFAISKVVLDVITFIPLQRVFTAGAVTMLRRAGLITVEEVGEKLVMSLGAKISTNLLGAIGSGVAVAVVDLGMDGIEGAILKGKLDGYIDKMFPTRQEARKNSDQVALLSKTISTLKLSLSMMKQIGYSKEQLEKAVPGVFNENVKSKYNAITDASVIAELAAYDKATGAYTDDDPAAVSA